ncbi:MAG: hypothetical protein AB7I38_02955 [Dehalococcoidia bacterium]
MNQHAVDDALVAQLARDAVARTAPEELPLFRATSAAYFDDPESLQRERSGDDMLGFGVGEALVLVTPVALSIAREVLDFVTDEIRRHAREAGTEAIDALVERLRKKKEPDAVAPDAAEPAPSAEVPLLSGDQLRRVRALAVEKAQALALPPDKADLLADSLVGSLATA